MPGSVLFPSLFFILLFDPLSHRLRELAHSFQLDPRIFQFDPREGAHAFQFLFINGVL